MFRFAISPSQDMHIGNLREALLNYICAIQADDKLLIRMEDVALTPEDERKEQEILEILTLFHISYKDIAYQSHNLKFHQQLATKLLMDKNAFSCFCTKESIDVSKAQCNDDTYQYNGGCELLSDDQVLNNESPFSIRIKRPHENIILDDTIKGEVDFVKESIDSFIILNTDKRPTYNFATALDDLLSDISMVVCSEDCINDTAKQILIRNYLGYDKKLIYAHLSNIQDADNSSIYWLLEEGFLPSAITNYLITLGNDTPVEIFDMATAIEWFDITKISKSPVRFDINRLKQLNRAHIKHLPALEVAKFIGYSSKDLGELAKIYTEEASTINEIKPKIDAIFAKKEPSEYQDTFMTLVEVAKKAPYFKEFDDFKRHLITESGLEEERILRPLRYLLTGMDDGPNLSEIYPHIRNYLGEIIQ